MKRLESGQLFMVNATQVEALIKTSACGYPCPFRHSDLHPKKWSPQRGEVAHRLFVQEGTRGYWSVDCLRVRLENVSMASKVTLLACARVCNACPSIHSPVKL